MDHSGRPLTAITGNRTVTSRYDGNGNLTSQNDGSDRTTTFTYDGLNRKTGTTQPDGLKTTYSYNPLDDLTGVETLNGVNTATYTYTDSKTISKTFAGNATIFRLDGLGRTVGITRPNGTARTDHYDEKGNLTTRTDFDGANWTHHYDPMNRPMSTSVNSASASETQTYTYDPDGNLTKAVTDGRTGTMTYDALNRLSSRTFENGKTVSYTYYPGGQMHTITDNLGSTIGYQYNASGLLDSVIDGSNNTLAAYTYTDEGYVDTITQPGAVTTYTHDNAGRILSQTAKDTGGAVLVEDTFSYNAAGNIQHKTETRGTQTWDIDYEYTTDHRLKGWTLKQGSTTLQTVAFQYDDAGNRTQETRTETGTTTVVDSTYNNFNQLTASTTTSVSSGTQSQTQTVSYSYDQGGRLISQSTSGTQTQTYTYNGFGYMVSARTQTPQATSEAAYTYSYDGKRISKYIDGTLYDYTYSASNLLETYADTAGRIAKYTYGHALISQSSLSEHGTLNTEHILTDYQNSVIATLTPTPTLYAYSPFGKLRYTSSEGTPQPLGWLGRQYDSETGNNYLINRYYSSDRGNFLSPDQYEYVNNAIPFTFNLYQYGYANPLVNVDPEGLEILSGDPLFNIIDQYEPQLSALDRAMTYYDLQQTYDYKGEGLFESYNPFLTRLAPVDANIRAYKTDSNGCYYAYKVMNLKEGQREPTLRYVPLNAGDSTVGKHFAFNSSFLEGLQWEGHVRSQAGRYQQNERDWGNFWGKFTNVTLNFAAVIDTALGLNKMAAVKLAQAERATAKVRLLNNVEEIRLARAARMRAATTVETDAPVMKVLTSNPGLFVDGVRFRGRVFRVVNRKYLDTAWEIRAGNIASFHRYSDIGRGALYTSTSREGVLGELVHYHINPKSVVIEARDVDIFNVLDLTNAEVRNKLGINLRDLVSEDYTFTQAIGDFARTRYRGLLAPSARKEGAASLILFEEGLH